MATNESTKTAAKSATKPEPAAPKDPDAKTTAVEKDPVVSTCVVKGGKGMHVGNAVNGKVCSYHAMHYDSHGNRR